MNKGFADLRMAIPNVSYVQRCDDWSNIGRIAAEPQTWIRLNDLRRGQEPVGVVLICGLIVAPGIVMGIDDMEIAPWWVWAGFVSWLGIFVLLPIWSISLGTALRRASSPARDGVVSAKEPHETSISG